MANSKQILLVTKVMDDKVTYSTRMEEFTLDKPGIIADDSIVEVVDCETFEIIWTAAA